MTAPAPRDWDPARYGGFHDLRLRPARDLLEQVPALPDGDIVDLGCGAGAAAPDLSARFPGRRLVGIDTSDSMLARARETGLYHRLDRADIAGWQPQERPALVFSNAALHWLADHDSLLPRLAGLLAPGGVLAVQMPRQYDLPSHRLLREIAAARFPDRFSLAGWQAPVRPAAAYWDLLAPLGEVQVWETDYLQHLPATADMHPVRAFTQSTAMRPYVETLTAAEEAAYVSAYDSALASAYPLQADGSALMPFRRLFFILRV